MAQGWFYARPMPADALVDLAGPLPPGADRGGPTMLAVLSNVAGGIAWTRRAAGPDK